MTRHEIGIDLCEIERIVGVLARFRIGFGFAC